MPAPPPHLRLLIVSLLLAGPAAVAFVLLGVVGAISPLLCFLAVLLTIILHALAIRLYHDDFLSVLRYLGELAAAEDHTPPAPEGPSPLARALNVVAFRMHRASRSRRDRLALDLDAKERILDALHDPLVLLDEGRLVLRANQAALAIFGERMVDRDLAASLRNPHILGAVDAVLAGGSSKTLEFTLPVPVERVYEARVKPFRSGSGQDGGEGECRVIVTFHDITAIKRSEQMRADFVANASHELRTPLASLVGFIETLRGPARDDRDAQERFLGIMHEQALRMSRLVNDLLSLSRIELDEHTTPTGQADVVALVEDVVAGLELRAAKRKVRIWIEAPEDLPPALGDEDQLSQVFQNLVDNAVKYGRDGTEVTVRIGLVEPAAGIPSATPGRSGPMLAVSVTDRGEGIARTHLPRLTERFYRADPARSKALGGTGLGLAIVKHIVNRHRGRITIESELGLGSTFTVYLPAAAVEAPPATLRQTGSAAE